jgi:hypothetical protein
MASHAPIAGGLSRLVRRGQRNGEFDRGLAPDWLIAATTALGHAAGQEVAAKRMTTSQAGRVFAESVLRVYGLAAAGPTSSRKRVGSK